MYEAITTGRRAQGPAPFRITGEDGELLGPFNAMVAHQGVGAALQSLGELLRYDSSLSIPRQALWPSLFRSKLRISEPGIVDQPLPSPRRHHRRCRGSRFGV